MFLTAEALLALIITVLVAIFLFLPYPNTASIVSFVQKNDKVTQIFETQGYCGQNNIVNCINVRYYFCPDGELHAYCVK